MVRLWGSAKRRLGYERLVVLLLHFQRAWVWAFFKGCLGV